MKLLVLLMVAVLALEAKICPKYEKGDKLGAGECVKEDTTTVLVRPCTDTKYPFCDITESVGGVSKCKEPSKREISEYCSADTDCASNMCKDKKFCKGKDENAPCDMIKQDCDVDLYCAANKSENGTITYSCKKAGNAGAACTSDIECLVPNFCINKKCALPFSADVKQVVSDQRACKTYFAELEGTDMVCANSYKYGKTNEKVTTPPVCGATGTCNYTKDGVEKPVGCDCGMTSNGTLYCKLFPAEFDFNDVHFSSND